MNKALLWDFDGTLSYPNKSFFTALHTAVLKAGYIIEKEKTVEFLEKAYSWKTPDISYTDKTGEKWWDTLFCKINLFCLENGIDEAELEKINMRFKELLINAENYFLYDDTVKTLEKCTKAGYKNYLATNNYPEIIQNLKKLGIATYFTDYIVSSHIGYEKPRAEFYNCAKKLSGNPEIAYMIGDNPIADISGGKEAGFITIAVHECKNSAADYYFENLADILSILK